METGSSFVRAAPALVALDWGTTHLRAYLMDASGTVMEERAEPWGIMQLSGRNFAGACRDITAHWPGALDLPCLASGMIGSAQGWIEAPYCPAPAGAAELARALVVVGG